MKGTLSFHPADLGFFDEGIVPLALGRKIDPERYLVAAIRLRHTWWHARRYALALERLADAALAPAPDPSQSLWQRVRTNLERFDHRPDAVAAAAHRLYERDLHGRGRPFFVTDGSAEKVAATVAAYRDAPGENEVDAIARVQLERLDPALARDVEPAERPELESDLLHRNDLLAEMKAVFDLGRAARSAGTGIPADAFADELPWRAVAIHSRFHPFWIADDVDGLETVCRAAGVPPPDCLAPAWRPFAEAVEAHPSLRERLGLEVRGERGVGAFVAPGEIGALLEFLQEQGARIVQAAAREGEGPAASRLLRKMKECAVYASAHGLGYLEASGILPPDLRDETPR